ncbi:multiubiquitin domain-containing protein [Phenylobacterium sp.]|jgi:hypothetical protein|uniref:multiubiquitin domain-containing protein n=1 Tax=Phenylobacterium sp. TaxID=1871053 RepID=UPI002F3F98D7
MDDVARGDVEDLETCAREGRRPRDNGPYRVQIGDALFKFQPLVAPEASYTGRSLLELAELKPAEQHVLFAVLVDGLLEEIRLEETVDLREGVERFLAFHSDRIFRLLIDRREYHWGGPFISGATVLKLARESLAGHGVWQQAEGVEHRVAATQLVDLSQPGVEIFITRPL